ncbi:sulfurtransferase TusA family protein [Haloarcula litorea]|uniref:sulfurtransferase TusA family protein n=1 Tax=Haloarcula litorea TaxID=3032579 RepID=UPI0023E7DDFF|nr:sulfurtransferase TusA family protein [Halomicroarcula sp. GDY20]
MTDTLTTENADSTIDVTGESCPMPVVRTRQAVDDLAVGEVLEVLATDAGSVSDIDGWAGSVDEVELRAQAENEEDGRVVYRHYVERVDG